MEILNLVNIVQVAQHMQLHQFAQIHLMLPPAFKFICIFNFPHNTPSFNTIYYYKKVILLQGNITIGFSPHNLWDMRRLYLEHKNHPNLRRVVAEIP